MSLAPTPWTWADSKPHLIDANGKPVQFTEAEFNHILTTINAHKGLVTENARLREALALAKQIIRLWHSFNADDERIWAIYEQHSPEMRQINTALSASKERKP